MKVIGVSGMPGSGKGVVSRLAKKYGFKIIIMGDVIREEALKRKEDVGETAVDLRREYGPQVVAKICIEKIQKKSNLESASNKYLIEGIRSPHEVELFQEKFPEFSLISVFSKTKTRFRRISKRKRFDDSDLFLEFKKRDQRELGFGIGTVIATSDYLIVNEGPLWKFKREIKKILEKELKN